MDIIWDETLEQIKTRMNPTSFHTWFSPTKQIAFHHNILQIAVPDKYFVHWLEEHYMERICDALKVLTGNEVKVSFLIDEDLTRKHADKPEELRYSGRHPPQSQTPQSQKKSVPDSSAVPRSSKQDAPDLNPKYTFDTYVAGGNNQFAYAASRAVADHPATAYNPLFLYGGNGLGKTHLLHAIGHAVRNRTMPGCRLWYVSFKQFTHELITALCHESMQQFREKYRRLDLLLIDDVHDIAGKERAQEEFFHTFNVLYNAHKQIVISSDRPPKKIPTIAERMRSRLEWGLLADIQPPDLETKAAILKKKAEIENIELPNEVALLLATNIQSNIRILERCVTNIAAHSTMSKENFIKSAVF